MKTFVLASVVAFLALPACVTEVVSRPESEPTKEHWRFEAATEGAVVQPGAPPTDIEVRSGGEARPSPQDPGDVPGLNPDLARAGTTLLPRKRMKRADGSEERFYALPGGLAVHYRDLIQRWCVIHPSPTQPQVAFVVDDLEAWKKAAEAGRAILLRVMDSPDVIWAGGGKIGEFGKLESGFGAKAGELSKWLAARGNVEDLDALDAFIETFLIGVDQVEITARIVESTVSDVTDIGSLTKLLPTNSKNLFQGLETNFPTVAPNSGILMLKGVHDNVDLEATLRLLQQESQVRFLATPRVTIRNGGSAALIKGDRVPIQNVTAITPAGALSTTVTYTNVGLQLKLSAFAVGRDAILLNLFVQNGNISGFTEIGGVTNPTITNRSANTSVILKQGQTLAIGGLISKATEERVAKTPLLGDIPILGALFRSTFDATVYGEVNFLFTPRIVRGQFDLELPTEARRGVFDTLADELGEITGLSRGAPPGDERD